MIIIVIKMDVYFGRIRVNPNEVVSFERTNQRFSIRLHPDTDVPQFSLLAVVKGTQFVYEVTKIPAGRVSAGNVKVPQVPFDPKTKYDVYLVDQMTGSIIDHMFFYVSSPKKDWVNLPDENDRKYCRCLLHVEASSKKSLSPYAICHKSVDGEHDIECGPHILFWELPDRELRSYASLLNIATPDPYQREQLIHSIQQSKETSE